MPLTPGTRLGAYEIVAAIGEGGMGEVYRARDPRLDREVAVKVLSPSLALDRNALARFEREAMSVAKLSHPNILSIFEFAYEGSTAFVVMELVEGETLRARLAHGALPSRRAVAYALQIAKGLAAAHARGITHRDLKPENVMITRDDHVKILDFGLAKPVETGEVDATRAGGVTTTAGMILGTFGYMAPEQVRGQAVDHRADMFAFGAVLYEMLTGERAFGGDTAADSMSAILTKDPPDLDTARLSISPGLDRIVRRCLEKTPDLRFQSANDLAFALETLSTMSTSSSTSAAAVEIPPAARTRRVAWVPWTIAAIAVVAAAASWWPRDPRARPEARWSHFTRISESAGEETAPSLSPDGTTVVYAARVRDSWDIYSQRVGGRNATAILNDPQHDEGAPAFSPDGSQIAFHRSDAVGGIFVAGATGESVRRITTVGFDPAWSPDGKQIAFATEEIGDPSSRFGDSEVFVVDAAGGTPRKAVDGDAVQPSWSPSGSRIVYWSNRGGQRDLFTVAAAAGSPAVPLTSDRAIDWSPVWSPDGKFIYFSSDRGAAMNLWRIPVDESSGQPRGTAEPVTAGVQASAGLPSLSKDGSRLAFRSRVGSISPVAIPFDPSTLRAGTPVVLDTQNNIRVPSGVSPDGAQIAFFSIGEHQEDLFIGSKDGPMRRVTDDPARDRAPVFTPDGRSLVFYSNRDGKWGPWIIGVDGGGLRKLAEPEFGAVYVHVSPKADAIVFISDAGRGVFTAPLGTGTSPVTELAGTEIDGKYFSPMDWSPDGTRLAGILNAESGRPAGVAVYDLAKQRTMPLSADETYGSQFLADGRRVVYFTKNGRELVVLDTVTHQRTVVDVRLPGPSWSDVFAISPDSRTIYYGAVRAQADIWIVERK
ncbi:MAG TPA: protein kinase [Vicinamibacterales bacterium]|nr:protein kinase [Vicinamibacterales bacterium]